MYHCLLCWDVRSMEKLGYINCGVSHNNNDSFNTLLQRSPLINYQAIVNLPLRMERKLHSESCTEFKMQSDYFLRGYNRVIGRYRSGQ